MTIGNYLSDGGGLGEHLDALLMGEVLGFFSVIGGQLHEYRREVSNHERTKVPVSFEGGGGER